MKGRPVHIPSQQVQRKGETAVVRLPTLRTDGLHRLRKLIADEANVRVKPTSYQAEWDADTAAVDGETVTLHLRHEYDPTAPPWTLVLAPMRSATPTVAPTSPTPPAYLLRVADPEVDGHPLPHRAQAGRWLTGDVDPNADGQELHWVNQRADLTDPQNAIPLAVARVNTVGARVLRGMQGLDPDSDLPVTLDGVIAEVDTSFDESDGQRIPPLLQLSFASNLMSGDVDHRSQVVLGPLDIMGGMVDYDTSDAQPYAPLVDRDAARDHARHWFGVDLDDPDLLRPLLAAGLTNILWRNTELENVHAGSRLSEEFDDAAARDALRRDAEAHRKGLWTVAAQVGQAVADVAVHGLPNRSDRRAVGAARARPCARLTWAATDP